MSRITKSTKNSRRRTDAPKPMRRFRVIYWEECGYAAIVEAADADSAEQMVQAMLDDEAHPKYARCTRGDCGVWSAEEVKE